MELLSTTLDKSIYIQGIHPGQLSIEQGCILWTVGFPFMGDSLSGDTGWKTNCPGCDSQTMCNLRKKILLSRTKTLAIRDFYEVPTTDSEFLNFGQITIQGIQPI